MSSWTAMAESNCNIPKTRNNWTKWSDFTIFNLRTLVVIILSMARKIQLLIRWWVKISKKAWTLVCRSIRSITHSNLRAITDICWILIIILTIIYNSFASMDLFYRNRKTHNASINSNYRQTTLSSHQSTYKSKEINYARYIGSSSLSRQTLNSNQQLPKPPAMQ